MQVLTTQLGARRHYAVPLAFQERGMLGRFYTDLYAGGGRFGQALRQAGRLLPTRTLQRWGHRHDDALDPDLVRDFPIFGFQYRLATRRARNASERTAAWLWAGRRFCELVIRDGLGEADAVYAYSSAALELFRYARTQGWLAILDHASAPKLLEDALVAEQYERYPGWAPDPQSDQNAAEYTARQRQEAEQADLIICGSTFVQRMVAQMGVPVSKTAVVPLGLRRLPDASSRGPRREGRLRILFVGDDALRKGVGDLVTALGTLSKGSCETRIAGNINLTEHGRRQAEPYVDLLGHVPRDRMTELYRWADVLVLPSVSDTFGLVILEAMAHGVPVITTPNTGGVDVIEPGCDGWIVPIHHPEALARCLTQVHEDRASLEAVSEAAARKAGHFTLENYGKRLVHAVNLASGSVESPACG